LSLDTAEVQFEFAPVAENQDLAVRLEFDGLAARRVHDFGAIPNLLAFSSVPQPLDVVVSLEDESRLCRAQGPCRGVYR
jgi:hypothetical protein